MNFKTILFRIVRYIRYWLLAVDEHSLHSPFLFQVYQNALNPSKRRRIEDHRIEKLRQQLYNDEREINTNTFGSGSSMSSTISCAIKVIARSGVSGRKQSEILVNIIETRDCKNILELGTSLGLNTIYLSQAQGVDRVITIDGNVELMKIAKEHFGMLECQNIEAISSDIDEYLNDTKRSFDFIYIDANHTYEATLRYFKRSLELVSTHGIVVIDDINWSEEMSRAWSEVTGNFGENLYLENDKIGIVFANMQFKKVHYILRF